MYRNCDKMWTQRELLMDVEEFLFPEDLIDFDVPMPKVDIFIRGHFIYF